MGRFFQIIFGLGFIVAGIGLEIMWLSFLFGSVLGVVLVLIFAPGLFLAPFAIVSGIGFAMVGW